ncbi:hypothetical protein CPC16_004311 [Podila verticillata]|nr:hypothetical protein BGZ52_004170 [Haplosporangium bisporale]KAF9210304.1 hypothetical protein BGZ59_009614 [Podila verticillata]KAF9391470.1 hypothetical protein CPC16_004311 [Podila verticillata]KAI9232778.1 MAG: nucleoporin complex subunit 54-domain-containing protein [Podila humilis]KFH73396.1 hypothetical protein MVEG_00612 [Podila verticillata NRRL 6337]
MSGFTFGAPASAPATGLFGAPAASAPAGGLFGAKPAAPAGGLFGAPSSAAPATGGLFGAPASSGGGLFGATASTAPAAGGLFGAAPAASTGGLFGATTSAAPATGSLFGAPAASAPTGGLFGSAPASTGGFGTSAFGSKPAGTTGFSFGGASAAPATGGLFGSAPKPFGSSFAPAFGASTAAPSVPTFGASLSTNSRQQYVTGNIKPEISAWQKFLYFKNAWDPTHPNCQFKFYFYNFVHPDDVSKYGPPPNTDPHEWMQAMQESPDRECMVPALAVGFEDLKKRMESQNDMTEMQRIKLDEIEAKMNDIMQFHLLQTASKVREFKRRHIQLAQRVLTLMKRVQILRNRGVPISQEEEKLRGRLEELLEQLKNPAHFRGKITELWAQIQILKDSKRLHPSGNYEVSDEAQLEVIGKVLADQQAGLQHITSVLQKDMVDIETLQRKLEEIGAAGRS